MDSSLGKALIMAGGILLAILVISFAMFSFRRMSGWSDVQKEQLSAEQVQKFNKEYEAYDKDLMYGVDIISCLNKAKSNNDKVDNKEYDNSFLVEVDVTFTKTLTESFRVYYLSDKIKKEKEAVSGDTECKISSISNLKDLFKISDDYIKAMKEIKSNVIYENSWSNNLIGTEEIEDTIGTFHLKGREDTSPVIHTLMVTSGNLRQSKSNPSNERNFSNNNWTKIEWETPAYSFKTRRFKCTNIGYSSQTGRVNRLDFVEFK